MDLYIGTYNELTIRFTFFLPTWPPCMHIYRTNRRRLKRTVILWKDHIVREETMKNRVSLFEIYLQLWDALKFRLHELPSISWNECLDITIKILIVKQ